MPVKTPSKSAVRRAYHHGELRPALVAAAREALETVSPDAVTLKSLALKLGVSQSAPYRHFETREAVLAAVAADGFIRFRQLLVASTSGAPDGEGFARACLAYVAFGRANRGVYKLMFASPIVPTSGDGQLEDAAQAAFQFLLDGVSRLVAAERTHTVALWVWSTLHGLVMLGVDCMLHEADEGASERVIGELIAALKRT